MAEQLKYDFKVVLLDGGGQRMQERMGGDYQYVESAGHPTQEGAAEAGRELLASGTWPEARGLLVEKWEQRPLRGWFHAGVVLREFPYRQ